MDSDIDGLVIELCFENNQAYRGTTVIRELRSYQNDRKIHLCPIVLLSTDKNIITSLDETAKKLLDLVCSKENLQTQQQNTDFCNRLKSLANGYKQLENITKISLDELLGIDTNYIDDRFISKLNYWVQAPAYLLAHFIKEELIEKQGLLIDEQVLAARLGINIANSSDWDKVKESLSTAKYKGVFSDGWQRWWMPLVDSWWKKTIKADTYLRSTAATYRVKMIKEKLEFQNIQSAIKTEMAYSEEFWTVCKGTNRPLDTVDGLVIINQDNKYPWQDVEYISIYESINEENKDKWQDVSILEKPKLLHIKKWYESKFC
jgi:hypothetical protein